MKNFDGYSWCLALLLLAFGPSGFGQSGDAKIGSGKTAEIYPVLNPAATELYFSRPDFKNNQGRDNASDIWMRTRDESGRWNRAINVGSPINSPDADRALGFSANGNRIAVLRGSSNFELDILQRDGRSWKSLARSRVPGTGASKEDIAYNLATGELIYALGDGSANKDLYLTKLDQAGEWSAPTPITGLNTDTDESRPVFAADGRTLYFFRSGQGWFRQTDRGAEATLTRLPILIRQFTVGLNASARDRMAVVALSPTGGTEELRGMMVSPSDYPPAGRVLDASTATGILQLTSGLTLTQRVGAGNRSSIFLRTDERIIDGRELTDLDQVGIPVGGLYSGSAIVSQGGADQIDDLNQRITDYERSLSALSSRREEVLAEAEWNRIIAYENEVSRDTLPKSAARQRALEKRRLEIEAMKEKFNRQQAERQRIADGGSRRSVTYDRPADRRPKVETDNDDLDQGLYGSKYASKGTPTPDTPRRDLQEIRERQRRDSLNRSRGISAPAPSNYGSDRYATQPWEYELQRTLPAPSPAAIAETARIDEQYQRQQAEVEALRAELARLRGQQDINQPSQVNAPAPTQYNGSGYPPAQNANPRPGDDRWAARGSDSPPAGYDSGRNGNTRRAERDRQGNYAPLSTAPGQVIGISFVPNTSYIAGEGYGGLEELYRIIQSARDLVEVRIHTPADMDRRAAQLLSEERAKTIEGELIDRGIAPRHFRILGFGNNETGKGGERVEVR